MSRARLLLSSFIDSWEYFAEYYDEMYANVYSTDVRICESLLVDALKDICQHINHVKTYISAVAKSTYFPSLWREQSK